MIEPEPRPYTPNYSIISNIGNCVLSDFYQMYGGGKVHPRCPMDDFAYNVSNVKVSGSPTYATILSNNELVNAAVDQLMNPHNDLTFSVRTSPHTKLPSLIQAYAPFVAPKARHAIKANKMPT